jgi:ActR/RegA family two-component response regulator
MTKPQVLIVEDETLDDYLTNLRSDEYDLTGVRSLAEAIAALEQNMFDVVITDLDLFDEPYGGMKVIKRVKELDATTSAMMVTFYSNVDNANYVMRQLGAQAFFPKPLDIAACRKRIHAAIAERRYRLEAIEAVRQGGFALIRNPYSAGKPLGVGDAMFYGRDEVFDFIRDNVTEATRCNHIALVGARRIGKTSILHELPIRLGATCLPVYVNCQSLGIDPGMPAFFGTLASYIRRGLQDLGLEIAGLPELAVADWSDAPALVFAEKFLPPLRRIVYNRMLALALDEFEELASKVQRGRLDAAVFEFLHSLMQEEKQMVFVLAGTRRLAELNAVNRAAGAIIQTTQFYPVGLFSPEQARRLIEEPVAYSGMHYAPEALEAILRATGGYPYLIQLVCGLLVNRRNEQRRNEMTPQDVQAVLDAVIETPQPGFFWETLTPHQQAVLIAACQLSPGGVIKAADVEARLQVLSQQWQPPVRQLLHELALEGLLRESAGEWQHEYTLAFDLVSAWVRRHKTLDSVWEKLKNDA